LRWSENLLLLAKGRQDSDQVEMEISPRTESNGPLSTPGGNDFWEQNSRDLRRPAIPWQHFKTNWMR